jgi:nucleoside-triphosphatase THEP1
MHHHHEPNQAAGNSVILVTGGKHCGKTTLVADFISSLSGRGLRIAGILARGLWRDNLRAGFDLVDLSDGSIRPLARRRDHPDPHHHLMFDFLEAGMRAGAQALDPGRCRQADMVVVDEVGKLEARGDGWATHIKALQAIGPPLFILIVRLDCMQRIRDRFGFHDVPVIDALQPHAIDRLRAAAERVLMPHLKERPK